ncbi:MAG: hypothetical protein GY788_21090 [bacterium]|nr:hypothetical protein [bacterium]
MPKRDPRSIVRVARPGGMNQAYVQAAGDAEYINNMRLARSGVWRTVGGAELIHGSQPNQVVHGVHWFQQHQGGRAWSIIERDDAGTAVQIVASMGTAVTWTISSGRTRIETPNVGTQFMDHGSWCYMFNGYEAPIRWNGYEVVRVGFEHAPPRLNVRDGVRHDQGYTDYDDGAGASPTFFFNATFQRGLGEPVINTENTIRYGYAWSWVNDLGHESPLSEFTPLVATIAEIVPGSTPITRRGRKSILITAEPPPPHVRAVRIYRTTNLQILRDQFTDDDGTNAGTLAAGGAATTVTWTSLYDGLAGAPLRHHSDHPAGGPIVLIDDKPDGELGPEYLYDQVGPFPEGVRYAAKFKGRLYLGGMTSQAATLRFSVPGFIEQTPEINALSLGEAGAGHITGMLPLRGFLVVFTTTAIFLVNDTPSGPRAEVYSSSIGHMASRTLVEVPDQGVIFWTPAGPYMLRLNEAGTAPSGVAFIGANVARWFEAHASLSSFRAARSVVIPHEREVWTQLPIDGDLYPNGGLVYHYDVGTWSIRTGWTISSMSQVADHRGLMLWGSWDTANYPGVHYQHAGATTIVGTAITSTYQTGWLNFGQRVHVTYIEPSLLTLGDSVTFEFLVDRHTSWQATADSAYTATDSEFARPVWDTALWSASGTWGDYAPALVRVDPDAADAMHLSWRVTGTRVALVSYDVAVLATSDPPKLTQVT